MLETPEKESKWFVYEYLRIPVAGGSKKSECIALGINTYGYWLKMAKHCDKKVFVAIRMKCDFCSSENE
jgi:hypothetical protein